MRLNDEQRKLVEANEVIIYKILGRCRLPIDEFYGSCAIALCNAALAWQPEGEATFETYATKAILNAIRSEMRKQTAKKRTAPERVPYSRLEYIGSQEFDPDLWAELGLFDEENHNILWCSGII